MSYGPIDGATSCMGAHHLFFSAPEMKWDLKLKAQSPKFEGRGCPNSGEEEAVCAESAVHLPRKERMRVCVAFTA